MEPFKKAFAEMRREARATAPLRWSRRELAQVTLLKGAHQESIAPLLRDCPVKVLERGDVLLRAGENCNALYIVLSGRLRMQDPSSATPDTPVRAGDSIGELSLLERATLGSTISAADRTRLLVVDRNTAWALIRTSHEIARNWLSLIAGRVRVSGTIAGSEVLKTSHERYTMHDERTGLNNRHWLESMLPRQIGRSTVNNAPLGLLLVEIDDFADYVARFGSETGDQACRVAAETLVNNVRPTDLTACYAIARFAVALPGSTAANVCLVAERVRAAMSRAAAFRAGDSALPPFTLSAGVAQLQPSADASALLAAAETALQRARGSGGNRVGMVA
jgi:diguanylate cyclase (GGDEF)-like protein